LSVPRAGDPVLVPDLRKLMIKYRIPPSLLRKDVLIDVEFLEDFTGFGDVVFPHAFPGFIFRYVGGTALDDEPMRNAVLHEYPHVSVSSSPPSDFTPGENLFVEAPPERSRDLITRGVLLGFERIFGVARESVVLDLTAEPGWKEYSAFSAFVQSFYNLQDAYRLPSDAFYPRPRGSMGGFVLERSGDHPDVQGYFSFLKRIFQHKRKKLSNLGIPDPRRPVDLSPDDLLELYVTTKK